MEASESITIGLDKETAAFLDELARSEDRDRVYLIRQAICNYIELKKWQLEEIKQAVKEADAGLFAIDEETTRLFEKWIS